MDTGRLGMGGSPLVYAGGLFRRVYPAGFVCGDCARGVVSGKRGLLAMGCWLWFGWDAPGALDGGVVAARWVVNFDGGGLDELGHSRLNLDFR